MNLWWLHAFQVLMYYCVNNSVLFLWFTIKEFTIQHNALFLCSFPKNETILQPQSTNTRHARCSWIVWKCKQKLAQKVTLLFLPLLYWWSFLALRGSPGLMSMLFCCWFANPTVQHIDKRHQDTLSIWVVKQTMVLKYHPTFKPSAYSMAIKKMFVK